MTGLTAPILVVRFEPWAIRRAVFVAGAVFVAFVFLYLLWAFPYSRLVHGGKDLRVYHGLLRWHYETAGVATYRLVPTIMTIGCSPQR